jgi:hypothetical protein
MRLIGEIALNDALTNSEQKTKMLPEPLCRSGPAERVAAIRVALNT